MKLIKLLLGDLLKGVKKSVLFITALIALLFCSFVPIIILGAIVILIAILFNITAILSSLALSSFFVAIGSFIYMGIASIVILGICFIIGAIIFSIIKNSIKYIKSIRTRLNGS